MAGLAYAEDYGDYGYHGDYDYDDGSIGTSDATESGTGSQRSRQAVLVRRSLNEGFGFTLRHFIAYPDENDQDGAESSSEPQETIFISGVVTGGPAYLAGVQLGDRVLSVNGLPVWDLSYADVVYQVQLSKLRLTLRLVPRDDDELQQAWGDTAHHPASNLNMKPFSHLPRPPPYRPTGGAAPLSLGSLGALSQTAVALAAPHLATTEDSSSLNGDRSGSSRRPSTLSTLSLQMPPSGSGSSAGGSEHAADASDAVFSRIRKDVETKQQFLAQPVWQAAQLPQTPVVREYHVNPARFPRTPWPPEAAAAAPAGGAPRLRSGGEQDRRRRRQRGEPATAPVGRAAPPTYPSPRGGSLSVSSSTDSLASLPGGVPNATARPYSGPEPAPASPEYVQYDAVTQVPRAKLPPPDHKTHIVSKRARQFETGCVDNDTYSGRNCYRSELDLIAEPGKRPSVRHRRSEFERDLDGSDNETSGAEEIPRRPPRSGFGNRMVIVGSSRLHAEPLNEGAYRVPTEMPQSKAVRRRPEAEPDEPPNHSSWPFCVVDSTGRPLSKISEAEQEASPENERKRNSAELIAGKVEEKKQKESLAAEALRSRPQHKTLRQPSYMAAVKTPTPEARPSAPVASLTACGAADSSADGAAMLSGGSTVAPPHTQHGAGRRPQRPNFLPLTPCHHTAERAPVPAAAAAAAADDPEDSVITGDPDTKSPPIRSASSPPLEPVKTSTPNSMVGAVRRQKPFGSAGEDDPDRAVRRISYRKATAEGGVFHTGNKEKCKPGKLSINFQIDRKASELPPKGRIQKLRNFFEEKAQYQLKRLERTTSTFAQKPSSPTWPSSVPPPSSGSGPAVGAQREGWLRVKLAMVDGKRAPDRSWRELWAVLRGDALSFYRDRKEVNQTPSSLEEQPVNVALCQLDVADDYVRRKNVFRLITHTRSEYLLQTEHLLEREMWLEALRPICQQYEDTSRSTNDTSAPLLSPTGILGNRHPNRQPSPTGLPQIAKARKPSQTPEQSTDSPKSTSWKGRVKRQFQKIHVVGSPQLPDGATLGVPLERCPPSESNPLVPKIVEMCTSLVEERGLDSEGIYRVPGNNAAIKSLSEAVNRGIHNVDLQADPRWTDVNVISSLLKSFFRKLPDSLVTRKLYSKLIDSSKIEDPDWRRRKLRELVKQLPDHNYETLKHLLRHLRRVTDPASQNKMDLKNLAIVFGPTLVRSSDDSTSQLVNDMSQQCGIVKTLISDFDYYFSGDESGEEQPPPVPDCSPPLSADVLDGPARHAPIFSTAPPQGFDSQGSPLDPKAVLSSIIFAANRKAQLDGRPEREDSDPDTPAARPPVERSSASECNNNRIKPASLSSFAAGVAEAPSAAGSTAHRVHVIPIQLLEEAPPPPTAAAAAAAADTAEQQTAARQRLSSEPAGVPSADEPSQDDTAIRSYAGLSQTTQERIRRFEEETKAMLQREKQREREARDHDLQRQRIEREWARAKQDLEHPDFLDELADNPADIARRIAELSTRLPGLTASAAVSAASAASAAADRDDRLSVTSDGCDVIRPPPPAWDTVSSGYSTMSSAGTGPRPGRARADSLPLRPPAVTLAVSTATVSLAPARTETNSLQRESRRASEAGERARWLTASSRLYRSPRLARRGGSAEDVAAAQSRKVELKRSEMALKARAAAAAAEASRAAARHRSSASRHESWSAEECVEVSPVSPPEEEETTGADTLAAHEGCDLVTSLVHTLDQKLQELGGRPAETEKRAPWSSEMYRDPSLHRSYSASCQLQMMNGSVGGDRSAPAPAPAPVSAPVSAPAARDSPRPMPAELTKKGMKRSIRQLCERFEQRAEPQRVRAAPGSPRALKRRHTVGGSKDIDRVLRLFLAASRAGAAGTGAGLAVVRPASCLVELDLLPLQPVPLESRV